MPYSPDKQRNYVAAHGRELNESVREIGEPPPIVDAARRESCRYDLHRYLTTYHPAAFQIPFSQSHLDLIRTVQEVMIEGGSVVVAMPRGSGKTTIAQRAEIWAALYGHRKFPMLLAADDGKFKRLLKGIKSIIEGNELLLADFPEICFPVRKLERIANRANFQMCRGIPTFMAWGRELIVLPTLAESTERGNAGVVVAGGGITSAGIRGSVATTPSGEQVRPDAVLIDDPQTRASAKSPAGVQEREDIVSGDILGMAGPGKRMAALCTCTVIYRGDLADRLLDPERSPDWKPIKVQTIQSWPTKMGEWEKYDAVRRQELLGELPAGAANAHYTQHRDNMDSGATVYWPERVDPGKLSAIQSAMDEYLRDPRAFMAERQNSPEETVDADFRPLNVLSVLKRTLPYKRGQVPQDCTVLTSHIDVQEKMLYWSVVAWTPKFGGRLIDYGTHPKQNRRYFLLRDVRRTLASENKGMDTLGLLRQGIKSLVDDLSHRQWQRIDGAEMMIDRGLVDARWQTQTVHAALIESRSASWMPCYGVGIGAKDYPLRLRFKKPGTAHGQGWCVLKPEQRLMRSLFIDVNFWKSRVYQALLVPIDHQSSITIYDESQSHHQLWADHIVSERATRVEARGRIVDEWELPPNRPDNHFWDNLVACAAGASLQGIRSETADVIEQAPKRVPTKRVQQLKV